MTGDGFDPLSQDGVIGWGRDRGGGGDLTRSPGTVSLGGEGTEGEERISTCLYSAGEWRCWAIDVGSINQFIRSHVVFDLC